MANYSAGSVLAIPYFPNQENSQNGEPRWIIVVEDLEDKVQILPLTSQLHQIKHYPKSIEIKKDSAEGLQMQLTSDSIILVERTLIWKKTMIEKAYIKGTCSEELIDQICKLIG